VDLETIVAIATPPGSGGIGIIRLSGSHAFAIGCAITDTALLPRHAHYCTFKNRTGVQLDTGICLYFPGPNSFTGEDVVEIQTHGGPVILDMVLRETCALGARQAQPGEFSQRAYLNNKIDLAQAEAIADLINSTTEQAALNASRSLQGVFSEKIQQLVGSITQIRVFVEAAIDFPEEEIDFLKNSQVEQQLQAIMEQLEAVESEAQQGSLMREGMKLVIAGKPNAGKSSLLNALSGRETAIVTAIEGTTRDVLREHIQIDGMPLHVVDTAGLRDSEDEIEREGIRRAWSEIESADCILLVVDSNAVDEKVEGIAELWPQHTIKTNRDIPVIVIKNKCDLSAQPARIQSLDDVTEVHLSAKTGEGLDLLKQHLKQRMGYKESGGGTFSARRRHLQSLENARNHLLNGQYQLLHCGAGELLAEDLRLAQNSLGEITGAVSSDALLGAIFSSFCIGK
jgi:tRNA modification GTPase